MKKNLVKPTLLSNEEQKESNITLNGDPAYIGPGTWYSIHILAKNSTTTKSIVEFIKFMNIIANNFPCQKCRNHIKEYLDKHDINNYMKTHSGKYALFEYTWEFHNTVNKRLGKPEVTWDNAMKIFYSEENLKVCGEKCSPKKSPSNNRINRFKHSV